MLPNLLPISGLIGNRQRPGVSPNTGDYGYCEDSGEPINIRRLIARPIATLSIEAQERHERMEKTHRDN